MTENKRFTLAYEKGNWWAVRDGDITLWKEEVIHLLNELNDENNKLNMRTNDLEEELDYYKYKCANLETGLFEADRENKRFWSEDYSVGYYTEIVDNDKELTDVPNPKKNLTIEEVVDLLNELNDEIKKLRTLNYVNKEAVRLNSIKTVKIGNNDVNCSNIDWEHLYELYGAMIDYYYDGDVE